jgi:hypothetical protein
VNHPSWVDVRAQWTFRRHAEHILLPRYLLHARLAAQHSALKQTNPHSYVSFCTLKPAYPQRTFDFENSVDKKYVCTRSKNQKISQTEFKSFLRFAFFFLKFNGAFFF